MADSQEDDARRGRILESLALPERLYALYESQALADLSRLKQQDKQSNATHLGSKAVTTDPTEEKISQLLQTAIEAEQSASQQQEQAASKKRDSAPLRKLTPNRRV